MSINDEYYPTLTPASATPRVIAPFQVRQTPWEELGTPITGARTVEEALEQAGMNFEVKKKPALFNFGTEDKPHYRTLPHQYITYRTDTNEGFAAVGERYRIIQNREALDFFDSVIERSEAVITNALTLKGGAICILQAQMPSNIHVPGDGETKVYVTLVLSHDGSGAVKAMITPVRIFCMNTLQAATKRAVNMLKITHTSRSEGKLAAALGVMGIYDQYGREMSQLFTRMTDTRLSEGQLELYVSKLFPGNEQPGQPVHPRTQNLRQLVLDYTLSNVGGQQAHPGTVYQAYNGITGYYQNVKNYGIGKNKETQQAEGRLVQGLLGDDGRHMQLAFEEALTFLN